jgi:hypothetical protein
VLLASDALGVMCSNLSFPIRALTVAGNYQELGAHPALLASFLLCFVFPR